MKNNFNLIFEGEDMNNVESCVNELIKQLEKDININTIETCVNDLVKQLKKEIKKEIFEELYKIWSK
jgi:hypothetical protein